MQETAGHGTGPRHCGLFTRVLLGGFHLLPAALLRASSPLCLTHNSAMCAENIPEPPPCNRALCGGRLQGCSLSLEKEFCFPRKCPSLCPCASRWWPQPVLTGTSASVCVCVGGAGVCLSGDFLGLITSHLSTEGNESEGASIPGSSLFTDLGQVGLALCE